MLGGIKMNHSINETTREERMKKVKKALAISISGAEMPTENAIKAVREYIDGKEELTDIQKKIIEEYNENVK